MGRNATHIFLSPNSLTPICGSILVQVVLNVADAKLPSIFLHPDEAPHMGRYGITLTKLKDLPTLKARHTTCTWACTWACTCTSTSTAPMA